jgi:hypothetical protein
MNIFSSFWDWFSSLFNTPDPAIRIIIAHGKPQLNTAISEPPITPPPIQPMAPDIRILAPNDTQS